LTLFYFEGELLPHPSGEKENSMKVFGKAMFGGLAMFGLMALGQAAHADQVVVNDASVTAQVSADDSDLFINVDTHEVVSVDQAGYITPVDQAALQNLQTADSSDLALRWRHDGWHRHGGWHRHHGCWHCGGWHRRHGRWAGHWVPYNA
jgi:hypothetical protein